MTAQEEGVEAEVDSEAAGVEEEAEVEVEVAGVEAEVEAGEEAGAGIE